MVARRSIARSCPVYLGLVCLLVAGVASDASAADARGRSRQPPASAPILLDQDCLDYGTHLRWAGSNEAIHGYPGGMVIKGNYAYVVDGRLLVVDITEPQDPVIVGSTGPAVTGLALGGGHAFTLWNPISTTMLFVAIDISNPSAPVNVTESDVFFNQGRCVAAVPGYAYVGSSSGVHVLDVSDPAYAFEIMVLDLPWRTNDILVAGNRMYVANGDAGFSVADITDPAAPVHLATVDTPDHAYAVALQGDFAYLADDVAGLQVFDVSDPAAPSLVGSVDTPGKAVDVVVAGDLAYVADRDGGVQVIDVSDPASPQIASALRTVGDQRWLTLNGDVAYVQTYLSGAYPGVGGMLQILDITNPYLATGLGSIDTPDHAFDVAVWRDLACVADYYGGLQIVDVADPAAPSIAGSIDTPGYALGVEVVDDLAYVADGGTGMAIVDVGDPAAPVLVSSTLLTSVATDIALSGSVAYVANGYAGLQLIDVSDPAAPVPLGLADTPGNARDVAVAGDIACVADLDHGLQVVDVASPAQPSIVGSLDFPGWYDETHQVAKSGRWAFVAVERSGFYVVDLIDPTAPVIVASLPLLVDAKRVTVADGYAYLMIEDSGVHVYDITDPASPVPVGTLANIDTAEAITVAGDCVYLARRQAGLDIFWRQCEDSVPVFLSSFAAVADAGGVTISWSVSVPGDDPVAETDFRLVGMRRENQWLVPCRRENAGRFVAIDERAFRDHDDDVVYALSRRDPNGEWILLDTTVASFQVPAATARGLFVNPNPINPRTTIEFAVNQPLPVTIAVYDLTGRLVAPLADRSYAVGIHTVDWDGNDATGRPVAAGSYVVRLKTPDVQRTRKIILLK